MAYVPLGTGRLIVGGVLAQYLHPVLVAVPEGRYTSFWDGEGTFVHCGQGGGVDPEFGAGSIPEDQFFPPVPEEIGLNHGNLLCTGIISRPREVPYRLRRKSSVLLFHIPFDAGIGGVAAVQEVPGGAAIPEDTKVNYAGPGAYDLRSSCISQVILGRPELIPRTSRINCRGKAAAGVTARCTMPDELPCKRVN